MKTLFIMLCGLSALHSGATELVSLPAPDARHVTLRIMFDTGSVDDPEGREGLTYLTARTLIDGGTAAMTKQQIEDLLYPTDGDFGVSVGKQAVVFKTTIHVDHMKTVYPVFQDLLLHPRFEQADFERVKEGALKTVTQDIPDNNDEKLSKRALDLLMYADHPYGHLVEGRAASLKKITLDDVKAHWAKVFTKNRLHVGLTGHYDQAFADGVVAAFDALPEGPAPVKPPQAAMPDGVEVLIVSKEKAFGSAIFMGFPMDVDRGDDDFAALLVANSYFGEHRNSYGRLYQQMRAKRSLNYGDYSYMEWYQSGHSVTLPPAGYPRAVNAFNIWIRPVQIAEQFAGIEGMDQPKLGNAVHSIRQAMRELKLLVDEGLSEEDFQRTRTFMQGYLRHYIQSPDQRLGHLMDGRTYGRRDYIEEMIALMGKLTRDDVNKALRKYLATDKMYLAVVTDDSEAKALGEALLHNASAPIVYKPDVRAGLDAAIAAEDAEIDAFKLPVKKVTLIVKDALFQ